MGIFSKLFKKNSETVSSKKVEDWDKPKKQLRERC